MMDAFVSRKPQEITSLTSKSRSSLRFRCRSSRWYSMSVLILPALKTAMMRLVRNRALLISSGSTHPQEPQVEDGKGQVHHDGQLHLELVDLEVLQDLSLIHI